MKETWCEAKYIRNDEEEQFNEIMFIKLNV